MAQILPNLTSIPSTSPGRLYNANIGVFLAHNDQLKCAVKENYNSRPLGHKICQISLQQLLEPFVTIPGPIRTLCYYSWTNQNLVLLFLDQSEPCVTIPGPIRTLCYYSWTDQNLVLLFLDQSHWQESHSPHLLHDGQQLGYNT